MSNEPKTPEFTVEVSPYIRGDHGFCGRVWRKRADGSKESVYEYPHLNASETEAWSACEYWIAAQTAEEPMSEQTQPEVPDQHGYRWRDGYEAGLAAARAQTTELLAAIAEALPLVQPDYPAWSHSETCWELPEDRHAEDCEVCHSVRRLKAAIAAAKETVCPK